ncbi:MAG: hypothetical protein ACTHKM_02385 [Tsuneonella sp.]
MFPWILIAVAAFIVFLTAFYSGERLSARLSRGSVEKRDEDRPGAPNLPGD